MDHSVKDVGWYGTAAEHTELHPGSTAFGDLAGKTRSRGDLPREGDARRRWRQRPGFPGRIRVPPACSGLEALHAVFCRLSPCSRGGIA